MSLDEKLKVLPRQDSTAQEKLIDVKPEVVIISKKARKKAKYLAKK